MKLFGVVKAGALTGIAVGLASHLALADPLRVAQAMPGRAMPPTQIVLILRSAGLLPTSEPMLMGATYVVRAVDPYGTPSQVIVDARYGYILSVNRIAAMEPMRRPPDPHRAGEMRARPDGTEEVVGRADRLTPPRAIPTQPDRSLSAAPAHPPPRKPRTTTPVEQGAKSAPASTPVPPTEAVPPTAAASSPSGDKQAAKQDGFPPVTPLQ